MTLIDPRAIIHPSAKLASNVTVCPYAIIGEDVEIGEGSWIGHHTVIKGQTIIGKHNKIYQFASLGEDPQDKKYNGEKTWLHLGDHNIIREFCTFNRGTIQGGGKTQIGNHNLFMAYVHVAHDCTIENHTIFANNASLAGHVIVEDYAVLSGFSIVHQHCIIGRYSFVAAATGISKDVLPFLIVSGNAHEAKVFGLNMVGLKRHGFSEKTLLDLKSAYKIIFRQNLTLEQVMIQLDTISQQCPDVNYLRLAIEKSSRGITR